MFEQIAQIRILLANINNTMQTLFHENEQLKKNQRNWQQKINL